MTTTRFEGFIREARAEKLPAHGRIIAMWAGIEAAKNSPVLPCPFGDEERDLVDGFRCGVAMGDRPTKPTARRRMAPVRGSYVAYSAPKEDEEA